MINVEEMQEACVTLTEVWEKALVSIEKLTKALSEAFGRMYGSEEETRKFAPSRKHICKHVPDVLQMSTYNYKPAMKRNLPCQRRNF